MASGTICYVVEHGVVSRAYPTPKVDVWRPSASAHLIRQTIPCLPWYGTTQAPLGTVGLGGHDGPPLSAKPSGHADSAGGPEGQRSIRSQPESAWRNHACVHP